MQVPLRSLVAAILLLVAVTMGAMPMVQAAEPGGLKHADDLLAELPPEGQIEYGEQAIVEMLAAQRTMLSIMKTDPECAATRLPLLNSLIEITRASVTDLRRFIAEGYDAQADAEFRKLVIALKTARNLLGESMSCWTGLAGTAEGDTSRAVEYAGADNGNETQALDTFPPDVLDPPPEASPFM